MAMEWNEWDGSAPKSKGSIGAEGSVAPTAAMTTVDARERHKLAERERRKSMRELFLSLHALLPHADTVRKEQSAILDEIVKYIPLAASRLRSLQNRRRSPNSTATTSSAHTPLVCVVDRDNNNNYSNFSSSASPSSSSSSSSTSNCSSKKGKNIGGGSVDCDIRVAPEPSSSVSMRVRGDRVNLSLTDTKGTSHSVLLSAVLDELEAHHLELLRSTHCRDGSKLLHYSESKIQDEMGGSPTVLKARLQDLACKLHGMRKLPPSLKRSSDHLSSLEDED